MTPEPTRATILLKRTCAGDQRAGDQLLPLVYDELHRLAERLFAARGAGHTLQPTALVHEAYLRLIDGDETGAFQNRLHFFRVAARAMRAALIDHARSKGRQKRGGDCQRVTLADIDATEPMGILDLLSMDEALSRLADDDPELARLVELRFFSGLTIEETAGLLGNSTATVERQWRVARAYLRRMMRDTT